MRLWRLERQDRDALAGLGGLHASGRWNPRGVRIVYASAHLSLAVLEKLVHLDVRELPDDLEAVEIDIPDTSGVVDTPEAELPRNWRALPAPESTVALGHAWAALRQDLGVRSVPSAVVPQERNYLLYPDHAAAPTWRVVSRTHFQFDPRMR